MPAIGKAAPDFALPSANGSEYRLADLAGHVVVLAFYRGDDSPTCGQQLAEYNIIYRQLRQRHVELLGIGPDSTQSHFTFGSRLELDFPLLADTKWNVAKQYGVTSLVTGYSRATFVIDAAGILRFEHRPSMGGLRTYTSTDAVLNAIDRLTDC